MKRKTKVILVVVGFFVAVSAITVISVMYLMFRSLETVTVPSKEQIQQLTRLDFSENVTIIGASYISSLDDYMYVALKVPADEIECLFPDEKFNPSTTRRYLYIENHLDREQEWFRPDSIENFKSFHYSDSASKTGIYVLYDNSEVSPRKVYILWFTF